MSKLILRVEVPITAARPPLARDYQETLPTPAPSTVFGLLMSLCGLYPEQAAQFAGCRMALGVMPDAGRALILRKMHRGDVKDGGQLIPKWRPEYQELLVDLTLWCVLDDASAPGQALCAKVREALNHPERVTRAGGLSLGESTFLINRIDEMTQAPDELLVVTPHPRGALSLSTWVSFDARERNATALFDLELGALDKDNVWITLAPC